MKMLQELLENQHYEPVEPSTKLQLKYAITYYFIVGANEFWFRTKLTARNKNEALRFGERIFHDNLKRLQSVGHKVLSRQVELVDKKQLKIA